MALVSGGRSTLNPNAPLFIPAAVRQVEDFSPEWWELVTTASWFRDYWLSQQQGEDGFYGNGEDEFSGNDVVDLLPDTIDLSIDDEFSIMEAQFEEFILSSEAAEASKSSLSSMKGVPQNGEGPHSVSLKLVQCFYYDRAMETKNCFYSGGHQVLEIF
ncbi:hypothetical protein CsSME_00039321 [Camellia sinensis var. sinensis]